MKVLVAACFTKNVPNGIDTLLEADVIEAINQQEALGIMLQRKSEDRQLGAYLSKEIKEPSRCLVKSN